MKPVALVRHRTGMKVPTYAPMAAKNTVRTSPNKDHATMNSPRVFRPTPTRAPVTHIATQDVKIIKRGPTRSDRGPTIGLSAPTNSPMDM